MKRKTWKGRRERQGGPVRKRDATQKVFDEQSKSETKKWESATQSFKNSGTDCLRSPFSIDCIPT